MLLGAHVPNSGGAYKSYAFAEDWKCTAMQIFTKSPNQWKSRRLTDAECAEFVDAGKRSPVSVVTAHDSYLINLASPDPAILDRSQIAFRDELERCERMAIPYLITHMGSHMGAGEEAGLRQLALSIDKVHADLPGYRVKILLEATAGQGNHLGYRFEHLAQVLSTVKEQERLGVCLDTCHMFVAGYDIRDEKSYKQSMKEFNRVVGLDRLMCFHLNDAKMELGSRRDRHERIGRGKIGKDAFRLIMRDRRLNKVPKIIETPDLLEKGKQDLALLRKLAQS